jgi:clan AA aspartic protease
MGRVVTRMKLTNSGDLRLVREGLLPPEGVRTLEIEALVDTGATDLVLPADVVEALGLPEIDQREIRLADGSLRVVSKVSELRIEILGRRMGSDAYVMPTGSLPLVGQIQLEDLDLVVDSRSRELRVNPDSPNIARGDLL